VPNRSYNILNIDEVPSLPPIPIDHHGLAPDGRGNETRHHSGIWAMLTLPPAKNVKES
jgi:hypothetical protein